MASVAGRGAQAEAIAGPKPTSDGMALSYRIGVGVGGSGYCQTVGGAVGVGEAKGERKAFHGSSIYPVVASAR